MDKEVAPSMFCMLENMLLRIKDLTSNLTPTNKNKAVAIINFAKLILKASISNDMLLRTTNYILNHKNKNLATSIIWLSLDSLPDTDSNINLLEFITQQNNAQAILCLLRLYSISHYLLAVDRLEIWTKLRAGIKLLVDNLSCDKPDALQNFKVLLDYLNAVYMPGIEKQLFIYSISLLKSRQHEDNKQLLELKKNKKYSTSISYQTASMLTKCSKPRPS